MAQVTVDDMKRNGWLIDVEGDLYVSRNFLSNLLKGIAKVMEDRC